LESIEDHSLVYAVLTRAAATLGKKVDQADWDLQTTSQSKQPSTLTEMMIQSGEYLGLSVAQVRLKSVMDLMELLREGLPVAWIDGPGRCHLFRGLQGRRFDVNIFEADQISMAVLKKHQVARLLDQESAEILVIKSRLDCDPISAHGHSSTRHVHGSHIPPLKRFLGLLWMDRRDIRSVALFALVSVMLGLAAPLAVESLVNVVSWGIYLQPLLVLALILFVFLGMSAALGVLQAVVVEGIQRRYFVRIVCDLSHRFPRVDQHQLLNVYPRELANRVFEIMTIQKATAELLIDGISIVLLTAMGLVLLGFYHPFLLGFDLILVLLMTVVTIFLGRGAIGTSIQESRTKYATFHWLQDVIQFPGTFRVNGGESLAVARASQLATDYVLSRKLHFRIMLRQLIFAAGLQVVALTALLGLGGWLVITGQLTLGQLIASELVVATVVGAFAKAGKSIEKFYDLMAGVEKVGHLVDLATEPVEPVTVDAPGAMAVSWQDLDIDYGLQSFHVPATKIEPGTVQAVVTREHCRPFAHVLVGILDPHQGMVSISGVNVRQLSMGREQGQWIGYASRSEVFHGSIAENIDLRRNSVGRPRVREVLQEVGLLRDVMGLPDGLNTALQTDGFPFSESQKAKLILARALAPRPRVLVIEGLLDGLPNRDQQNLMSFIKSNRQHWTTIVITGDPKIAAECDSQILLEEQT
jgi:putative ABC transport system ATP-binding protein